MAYVTISKDQVKLMKRIGQGTFGTVYRGTWQNQVVAVKRVDKEEAENELKLLSKLDHQHIVKLLGVTDNDLDTDIVLEFCDGGSLRNYLDAHRGKHLGMRFFDWSKQAGKPIAYLNAMGVVHKDIKSPNYLVSDGSILKLCDFGLAKEIDATMTSATERASYPWMAPELLKDSVLSPTYDIFAYGVVVWELLTTDIPFEDSKIPANLVWRICEQNERPPIPLDCPKVIADLLKQCWKTDWKKRPNMEQALSMLHKAETYALVHGWKLQREIPLVGSYQAHNIAVCPNGNIVTVDYTMERVSVYNSNNGELARHLYTMQETPYAVAVNADGILYVTRNHNYVLMYTEQGEYKGRWIARSPDNNPSGTWNAQLCGLIIDNHGQLLVGNTRDPMYISKHRQNGSHIASIKVNIVPSHLAVTLHDTIVISDCNCTVQIVDSTGLVLHTLNSFRNAVGICCYNDIIFICNNNKKDKYGISCFSASAEHIGSMAVKEKPYSVAFDKDKCRVLVGCQSSILIYTI